MREGFDLPRIISGGGSSNHIDIHRMINSALDLSRYESQQKAIDEAVRKKNERDQKTAAATIELNEQTKVQNELLSQQLQEERAAVRASRRWNWIMFVVAIAGVAVAVVGVVVAILK